MEEPVAEKVSAVQQLKALDEQRAKILETAKTDALAKANEAVEELNALGFKYALTDLTPKPKAKATTTGNNRAVRKRMRVLSLQNHTAARQAVASYPEEKAPLHRRRAQRTRDGESLN